jgi:hypothetical protein
MAKADQTLQDIREEVRELRVLYKSLIDRLVPVEKPTKQERRAIEETDEVAGERELMKALGVQSRD